jgi:uncharacterized membrane protein YbhN (UPF0104 family)
MNGPNRRRRILRILPGLVLGAAAIVVLAWNVDWQATASAWSRAQLWVLIPALVFAAGAMLTRAIAWRYLMGNVVPLRRCFWVLTISYLLNGILPMRLGDVARAYLISRRGDEAPAKVTAGTAPPRSSDKNAPSKISAGTAPPQNSERGIPTGISAGTALSAVALERMFDLTFTLILVLSVFPMIAGVEWSGRVLLYAVGLALVFFLALLLAGVVGPRILRVAERAAGRFPLLQPVLAPMGHFLDGLKQVRNVRFSLPAFAWIGVTMLLWAAEYWVVLNGFFPGAPLYWGLLSLIGGLIGVAIPAPPSSLGVFEAAVVLVLTMSGMARDPVVAFAIAIHMLNIIVLSGLGALGLLFERRSLGSILAETQSAPPQKNGVSA